MRQRPCYEAVAVNKYCLVDPRLKYQFMQDVRKGLTSPTIMYTCSLGSNLSNYNFIWRIPSGVTLEAATNENIRLIEDIKKNLPTYHSRALKQAFMNKYGQVAGGMKSYTLCQMYPDLTLPRTHAFQYFSTLQEKNREGLVDLFT